MPNLTIYVPQGLADLVREHNVKVSETCQSALRRKVRMIERELDDPKAQKRAQSVRERLGRPA